MDDVNFLKSMSEELVSLLDILQIRQDGQDNYPSRDQFTVLGLITKITCKFKETLLTIKFLRLIFHSEFFIYFTVPIFFTGRCDLFY